MNIFKAAWYWLKYKINWFLFKRRLKQTERFVWLMEKIIASRETIIRNEQATLQNTQNGKVDDGKRRKSCEITRIPSWNTKESRR